MREVLEFILHEETLNGEHIATQATLNGETVSIMFNIIEEGETYSEPVKIVITIDKHIR